MKFIGNRCFLLMKPKMPFVDWINDYDDTKVPEENILSYRTLYMLEDIDDDSPSSIRRHVKRKYKDIFINELWSWYTDEDYLPDNITFELFTEWFDYEFIEMCFDAEDSPLKLI